MIIENISCCLNNGNWEIRRKTYQTLDMLGVMKRIDYWYKDFPYAKRINDKYICSDYRIDQQRPQRNVRSDYYIKIVSITPMEEIWFDKLIEKYENKIDYPTTWDDGENRYYEETIYCPKCGKRRKVLTSHTHCEFCGFEFNKAIKCPKCNSLNLKGSNHCINCNYEFRKESFINNKEYKVKKDEYIEKIKCPKCGTNKSKYFDTCQNCGFEYKNKKECPKCHEWIDEKDKYCCHCGQKQIVYIKCEKCGSTNKNENNYCKNCGEKLK